VAWLKRFIASEIRSANEDWLGGAFYACVAVLMFLGALAVIASLFSK
jgi:hypothetical protein